jgi:hypothetical protein
MRLTNILAILLAAVSMTACSLTGSETATPSPTPPPIDATAVPTLAPTFTFTPSDTPTHTPTYTVTPSLTPVPPTATETPIPTDTSTPSPTPVTSQLHDQTGNGAYLWRIPGTEGAIIQIVYDTMPITLVGRSEDSSWLQVKLLDNGVVGWLPAPYVRSILDINEQPVTANVEIDTPPAMVKGVADGLRLRVSPGQGQEIIAFLASFTELDVVGRSEDYQWLEVVTPDDTTGWVSSSLIDIFIDLDDIEVTGAVE